jgi:hypothetical protein
LFVLFTPAITTACYLYDWPTTPTFKDSVYDTPGEPRKAGQDITNVWHAYDGGSHFFRLDLLGEPSRRHHDFSKIYGFYIDSKPGGNPADFLLPGALSGIDYILYVSVVREGHSLNFRPAKLKEWNTGRFDSIHGGVEAFQHTRNGGKALEWKIDDSRIDTTFNWWAVSSNKLYGTVSANDIATPIPGAAWLFGTGVLALIGLRKKRRFITP